MFSSFISLVLVILAKWRVKHTIWLHNVIYVTKILLNITYTVSLQGKKGFHSFTSNVFSSAPER